MRIGIDIDGVLTDVGRFCVDYGTKYFCENNIKYDIKSSSYEMNETFNVTKEQDDNFWKEYLMFYAKNEKARPFSSEVIKKLKEDGHEIYIITARWLTNRDDELGEGMRKIVKNWLAENDIIYDKLVFSKADKERKSQEIIDYKIDLMIEDNPNNINELSKLVNVICYDTEYNRECTGENIIRCYSWYDIYERMKTNV